MSLTRSSPAATTWAFPHSCDNRTSSIRSTGPGGPYTQQDWALSDTMLRYWANFARTGDPNGDGLAVWATTSDDRCAMRLAGEGCGMRDYRHLESMNAICDELIETFSRVEPANTGQSAARCRVQRAALMGFIAQGGCCPAQ